MKGEIYTGKSDFLLPQAYQLKSSRKHYVPLDMVLLSCNIFRQVLDE